MMKLIAILLPLSLALVAPATAAQHRPEPRAAAPAEDYGFDWLLGGLGLVIVLGAIGSRPRRMVKVSA